MLIEAQACDLPCLISNTNSRETAVTDRLCPMSLNESPERWAEEALRLLNEAPAGPTIGQTCAGPDMTSALWRQTWNGFMRKDDPYEEDIHSHQSFSDPGRGGPDGGGAGNELAKRGHQVTLPVPFQV